MSNKQRNVQRECAVNTLHIGSTDVMGGRFTGYYTQRALEKTHTAETAVWNRTTDNPGVHSMRPGRFLASLSYCGCQRIRYQVEARGAYRLGGVGLAPGDWFERADVVHLHLIHNDAYFGILS